MNLKLCLHLQSLEKGFLFNFYHTSRLQMHGPPCPHTLPLLLTSWLKVWRANAQFKFPGSLSKPQPPSPTDCAGFVFSSSSICYLLASLQCVRTLTVGRTLMTDGGGGGCRGPVPRDMPCHQNIQPRLPFLHSLQLVPGFAQWAGLCVLLYTWQAGGGSGSGGGGCFCYCGGQ